MRENELPIPPETSTDPEAFELLRVWAANNEIHVALESGFGDSAQDFGVLVSDLMEHGARLYAERDGVSELAARKAIMKGIRERLAENKNLSGEIGE
jgi:hypothetical protein